MLAEFYIIPDSFENNSILSTPEIEEKTNLLANDFIYIRKYKASNKLLIHSEIYNIKFINNVTISDLLFNDEISNQHLERDVRQSLKKIVLESEITTHSTQEVKDVLLPEHSENICHGLIAFNPVEGINPEFQVIYNINGWLDFRRYYLKLYPKNESFFIDECSKYFPNLFFHERNKTTVTTIFYNCHKRIIYHLIALNDNFRMFQTAENNRTQTLQLFSAYANLDETASLEGNPEKKVKFTFEFLDSKGNKENVCCEPHLKLCFNDSYPGDTSYSNNRRIYFFEGKENIENGKILIGHIGKHL